jgi:hypothetical protein
VEKISRKNKKAKVRKTFALVSIKNKQQTQSKLHRQNIENPLVVITQLLIGAQASSLAYIREDVINTANTQLEIKLRFVRAVRSLQARTLALQSVNLLP